MTNRMHVDIAVDAMREYMKDTMHQRLSIDEYDAGIANVIVDALTEHVAQDYDELRARLSRVLTYFQAYAGMKEAEVDYGSEEISYEEMIAAIERFDAVKDILQPGDWDAET